MNSTGYKYAFFAFFSWGILPIYWRSVDFLSADLILSYRILWSVITMTLIHLLFSITQERITFAKVKYHFIPSAFLALNWLIFIYAVNEGHLLEVGLGYYLAPILSCAVGYFLFNEVFNTVKMLAIFFAFSGVCFYTYSLGSLPVFALLLAATFVLYGVSKKRIKSGPTESLLYESLALLPFSLIYLLIQGENLLPGTNFSFGQEVLIALSGVVTIFPLIWFTKAAKLLDFSTLGFFQYIGPTTNFLLAIYFYHEHCSQEKLITFIFIWIAVILFAFNKTLYKVFPTKVLRHE